MQHSVTIGGHNTYKEWGMVPQSRLHVSPPEVKTNYIDVPGADGQLDYTTVLTGSVRYGRRTGSWEFWLKPGERWMDIYTDILMNVHGKEQRIYLTDDPDFFYQGRVSVNDWTSEEQNSKIVLDYNLDPYKYGLDSTKDIDWLWNDLFSNVIYYGTFDVDGSMARNLINPGIKDAVPTFICSSAMTVNFKAKDYSLVAGENRNENIVLKHGNNHMTFKGTGRVTVDYSLGKSL